MTKLRPSQRLPEAKKITKESLAANPLLRSLARERSKQIRELQKEAAAETLFPTSS